MRKKWDHDPARVELLNALREFRNDDGSVDDRGRVVRACGPLWGVSDQAPMVLVAAMADVIADMPPRKKLRTYAALVRIILRQMLAEDEGKVFHPYGRRRLISRGD